MTVCFRLCSPCYGVFYKYSPLVDDCEGIEIFIIARTYLIAAFDRQKGQWDEREKVEETNKIKNMRKMITMGDWANWLWAYTISSRFVIRHTTLQLLLLVMIVVFFRFVVCVVRCAEMRVRCVSWWICWSFALIKIEKLCSCHEQQHTSEHTHAVALTVYVCCCCCHSAIQRLTAKRLCQFKSVMMIDSLNGINRTCDVLGSLTFARLAAYA